MDFNNSRRQIQGVAGCRRFQIADFRWQVTGGQRCKMGGKRQGMRDHVSRWIPAFAEMTAPWRGPCPQMTRTGHTTTGADARLIQ